MKIVLREDVKGLGAVGDVKDVADGYARNFLIPRRLAEPATPGALKNVEAHRASLAKRQAQAEAEARALSARLNNTTLTLKARVGGQDRLYGSITAGDIAAALGKELGAPFDRRKLVLDEPIRELGTHTVPVHLARDVTASLTVRVEAEE
ncbi:MAG TPA: 50S ribosomal protein L9 [Chloroflexota bacterium]|nr:50S ribosomal protein L9 [Chloroflexota bacterium]